MGNVGFVGGVDLRHATTKYTDRTSSRYTTRNTLPHCSGAVPSARFEIESRVASPPLEVKQVTARHYESVVDEYICLMVLWVAWRASSRRAAWEQGLYLVEGIFITTWLLYGNH